MEIIPVIDLLNGQVVHAKRGERQHYLPIQSSLCGSSEPLAIVEALLELYPFSQLYIADLDSIQKLGSNHKIITRIKECYPKLTLWLDCGLSTAESLKHWRDLDLIYVIGSESLANFAHYSALKNACGENCVLSLDFTALGYQGPVELLASANPWPEKVIAMTLSQVGSDLGPDKATIEDLLLKPGTRQVYAAGGIRGVADLIQLKKLGASGALVATALHSGALNRAQITTLMNA